MRIPFFSWLVLVPICTLFLNFSTVFVVSHQCLGNQRFLLLELKKTLIFDSTLSTKLVKWNQNVDCCSWDGVTCNEGRVIGLDLSFEFISGGLDNSSSLFSLEHLQSLSFAVNNFNSPIPSKFDKLANLSYLSLFNAGFVGQIPIAISRLTRLVHLDLSSYSSPLKLLNPNLNVLVQNLPELVVLYLDAVLLSAHGKEWCQALSSSVPNLRELDLSWSNLLGPIDSSLRNLQFLSIINLSEKIFQVPTLQTLDMSYNSRLEVSLPEFLPNGSLQTMVFSYTNFSSSLPPSISKLKMLSRIDLVGCNFHGSIPDSIANLTQLAHLDLSNNNFNGSIPDSIASITQLSHLDLSNNNFESIPDSIASLTQLSHLDLSNNNLNGSIPSSIASLTQLAYLNLSDNSLLCKRSRISHTINQAEQT
ncbi:receptor-like protein 6 [Corylus avellana]|uniref:receptor-like protein 6 n=1 Tax=Corylus avellana TaxID=13451 RepID=UPI00286D63E7|nr:receptor-like protein 6 [Corylus avellana]